MNSFGSTLRIRERSMWVPAIVASGGHLGEIVLASSWWSVCQTDLKETEKQR